MSGVLKDQEDGQCGGNIVNDNFRILAECKILQGLVSLCKYYLFYSEGNGYKLCSLKQSLNICCG